jgi:putative PEP-CTERM system TPR-repeat lipoprotein
MQKNVAKAVPALETIKADSPVYIDSLMLKARAHQVLNELTKAIDALKIYTDAVPQSNIAKLMLAETYVRNSQPTEAEPIIDALLARFPEQPVANYLKSTLEIERKNFVKAKEHAEKAINNGYSALFPRIVAAMANISLDLNAQALNHLRAVKDQLKQVPQVEKAYAMLELQEGNTDVAAEILKNQNYQEQDLKLIAAATSELTRQGSAQAARELLQHVEQNIDKDVQSLAALGMIKISLDNDAKAGIADLEAALSKDPTQQSTQFNLALAYLAAEQYDKLASITQQWKKEASTKALAHTFEAYALMQQNKVGEAKAAADEALTADSKSMLALMLKARIALAENDNETAKKYTNQALVLQPDFAQALEISYSLNKGGAGEAAVVTAVNEQLTANPESSDLRSLLGRIYIDKKQFNEALQLVAADKSKTESKPAVLWQIQLTALQQTNELKKLLAVAEEWQKAQPGEPQASVALVQALTTNKQFGPALAQLTELRKKFPNDARLNGMEILLQAENGNFDKALSSINALPADIQNNPSTLFLKARLQAAERDFGGAITTLKQSYQIAKLEPTTLALADLLSRNESPQAAVKFLDNHFSTEARTPNLQATYANLLLSIEPAKAEQNFLELIKADEENLLALNNLAYLYAQQNKVDEARTFAEKALKISPNHPDVLDTMGMVLLKQGEAVKAQEQFKQSLQQRPGHPEVLLNLAEAQLKSGDKAAASKTLEQMVNTTPAYQQRKQQLTNML